uniref:Uncharacterized protein n=1 Tax=viral metagenome TaxID=1070528 RepID=A0A6C0HVG5_9ZZZZ
MFTQTIFLSFMGLVLNTQGFITNDPLKRIALSRAFTKTFVETMALNVVDQSTIIHELTCNCQDHPYLTIYFASFICFGYMFVIDKNKDKLQDIKYYSHVKKTIKQILLIMFLIFGKNLENAI